MFTPFGTNIHDPWAGKAIGTTHCEQCGILLALAEEFTVTVSGGRVHPACFLKKLNSIGTQSSSR